MVALVWPVLQVAIRRRGGLVEVGSAAGAGLGLFWFVTRAYADARPVAARDRP